VDDGSCTHLVGCGPGATVTYHGESYPLVTIGAQCWFKKNLNTAQYRTGEALLLLEDNAEWAAASQGAWCYYNNDASNGISYGKLYNFYAVNDARSLCPSGWHIPTDGEWIGLGVSVGATALKSSGSDSPPWNGTNSSGFSAVPGGIRNNNFNLLGSYCFWWSSSPSGSSAGSFFLDTNSGIYTSPLPVSYGFSVRCVRDE
jgi:uncharacterized protein (TIGR02145 family)